MRVHKLIKEYESNTLKRVNDSREKDSTLKRNFNDKLKRTSEFNDTLKRTEFNNTLKRTNDFKFADENSDSSGEIKFADDSPDSNRLVDKYEVKA